MTKPTLQKSLGNNFLFTAIATAIIGLINYGYPLLIGLIYGAEIMAKFSVPFYWSTILSIPIINGIAPAVARFLAASSFEKVREFEGEGTRLTSLYLVLLLAIFPAISLTILNFSVLTLLIVLFLIALTIFHYLFRKSLQGQEKFSQLIIIEGVSFLFFLPFMVVFSILPEFLDWSNLSSYNFLFLPIIAYHLMFNIIFLIGKFQEINLRSLLHFSSITKRVLRYAFLIGFGDLLTIGISQSQIIISDRYLVDFEVGVLSFLNSAITPITLVSVTLSFMLLPRVTNLQQSEKKLGLPFVNAVNWGLSLTVFPFIGLLFLIIGAYPSFLDVLTFSKYQMTTYWPVLILLIFQVINNLLTVPSLAYFAASEKNVLLRMVSSIIYTIAIILSWIFLVPRFGIFGFAGGCAIGGVISLLTVQTIALILTKRRIGLQVFFLIGCYALNGGFIILLDYWSNALIISLWSVFALPAILFGGYQLYKILKQDEYSFRYQAFEEQKVES
ncbi:MAG: hypothetical protein GF308_02180 [Candidatus Heimdallarchaeota archaeon]|nr:hypothetical protein [Candidatus Heimdallarchaeota archaeon]